MNSLIEPEIQIISLILSAIGEDDFLWPEIVPNRILCFLLGILTNGLTYKSAKAQFDCKRGVFRLILLNTKFYILSCSLFIPVIGAFCIDYRPEWICVLFFGTAFVAYYQNICSNLFISLLRYQTVKNSEDNSPSLSDLTVERISTGIHVGVIIYFTLLYCAFRIEDCPWTSFIEVCRFGNEARDQPGWTNVMFAIPELSITFLTLFFDLRLTLFLKSYTEEAQDGSALESALTIPIRATVVSAFWLIPQVIISQFMSTTDSSKEEMSILMIHHRIAHVFKLPLLYFMTFAHHKKARENQNRQISRDKRQNRIRDWAQQDRIQRQQQQRSKIGTSKGQFEACNESQEMNEVPGTISHI